jgi:hypothetical protein
MFAYTHVRCHARRQTPSLHSFRQIQPYIQTLMHVHTCRYERRQTPSLQLWSGRGSSASPLLRTCVLCPCAHTRYKHIHTYTRVHTTHAFTASILSPLDHALTPTSHTHSHSIHTHKTKHFLCAHTRVHTHIHT